MPCCVGGQSLATGILEREKKKTHRLQIRELSFILFDLSGDVCEGQSAKQQQQNEKYNNGYCTSREFCLIRQNLQCAL